MEFSVGMIIRDGLGIKTCGIKSKGQEKAEGKIQAWLLARCDLTDPTGALDKDGPSGFSWHIQWPTFTPPLW